MGLDEHFSSVRSQILLMDPLPPLNKVFALILQDERQKEVVGKRQQQFDAKAFASRLISNSTNNQRAYYKAGRNQCVATVECLGILRENATS